MVKIQDVINLARDRAKSEKAEHVLPEHLAYELLLIPEIKKVAEKFGIIKLDEVLSKIDVLIKSKPKLQSDIIDPEISFSFEYVLKQALAFALLSGKKTASVLDLFISLVREPSYPIVKLLKENGLDAQSLENFYYSDAKKVIKEPNIDSNLDESPIESLKEAFSPSKFLKTYTEDYVELAKKKKFPILVGRENEIKKIMHILTRRTKNSAILVGDSGVGKTTIIEGLATKIAEDSEKLPNILRTLKIYGLDINNLIAGAKHHGSFEERIKGILEELQVQENALLFIDDTQNIIGNGGSGMIDLAGILKNYISRGKIKMVGCLTEEDYRRSFDKDTSLSRRFSKIEVLEPTIEETKEILNGIRKSLQDYYKVIISDDILDYCISLSNRYMPSRKLPDKAIDLLDSALATARMNFADKKVKLTKDDIITEISNFTKISGMITGEDDKTRLKTLKEKLSAKIFGQEEAIEKLVRVMYVSKSGLRSEEKTVANILFQGSSAVGKTATAKELANILGVELVRFDLSTYQEKFTLSALIGSPPGYLGYSDGRAGEGLLINAIERNPNCVLLLDEVEKAHPDVLNILLQVMDYGMLTSAAGKIVNCRNVILIMTSNIGSEVEEKMRIGFGQIDNSDKFEEAFKSFFRPEFRTRLDAVIKFNKLGHNEMAKIVQKMFDESIAALAKKNITIHLDVSALEYLTDEAYNNHSGARIVSSLLDDKVKPLLAEVLINSEIQKSEYLVKYFDGKIVIE